MSVSATSFRNLAGRHFKVGDNAVAVNHSAFPGRVVPCRVFRVESAVLAETMQRQTVVEAEFYVPASGDAVAFMVHPDGLFPSFEIATTRCKVPKCLGRLLDANPVVAAMFHSQQFLDDERFETLDYWLNRVDAFVDSNDLGDDARERIDGLRELVSRARLNALKIREDKRR